MVKAEEEAGVKGHRGSERTGLRIMKGSDSHINHEVNDVVHL